MAYIASDSAFTAGSGVSIDTFTDGPDYTAGTSSQVTLSENPASENSVWVFFNGIAQHHSEYSINGKVVSFTSVIPSNVSTIEVQNNLQLAVGVPGAATVEYSTLTNNAITTLQRKNAIINGNMDIWQRGTSHSTNGYGSADRWKLYKTGTGASITLSQQSFALGQTAVPNEPEFFARNTVASGSDATTEVVMYQHIEGARTFAGDTVTISFWAKTSVALDIAIEIGHQYGTGGTPSSNVFYTHQQVSCTTSWAKYEVTFDVPSLSGETLGTDDNDNFIVLLWFSGGSSSRGSAIGLQSGSFDISQMQVEKGITATDFERRSAGEELLLCQRYYWTNLIGFSHGVGYQATTGSLSSMSAINTSFPVTMRSNPTMAIITAPTLINCTTATVAGWPEGFTVRVQATAVGRFRASGGVYEADAEF